MHKYNCEGTVPFGIQDTRLKYPLGYGIRGNEINGIRDTYKQSGIPDTTLGGFRLLDARCNPLAYVNFYWDTG